MKNSKIEWTDHTFNPWIGCHKISPGCANCYAATLNHRFNRAEWVKGGHRHKTDTWKQPLSWNRRCEAEKSVELVFCASMADVFETLENREMNRWRDDMHQELISQTPYLRWLLLTKRPENIKKYYQKHEMDVPRNVWLGTSVESQDYAKPRIERLIENEAAVRFLSCEPLLGPLDLTPYLSEIDWVIVGGESGGHARTLKPEWVASIRDQCRKANVAFFFKQWGGIRPKENGSLLDGKAWKQFPKSECVQI